MPRRSSSADLTSRMVRGTHASRVWRTELSPTMESPIRIRPLVFVTNGEADFLLVMQQLLEDEGYDALVMQLADHPFADIVRTLLDLIGLDFPYHEAPAWDLLTKLDADLTTRLIPVLAISTDPDNLTIFRDRVGATNPSATLVKPFDVESMLANIAALLPERARIGGAGADHASSSPRSQNVEIA